MKLVILDTHGKVVNELDVSGSKDHYDATLATPKSHIQFGCQIGGCGACLIKTDYPDAFQPPSQKEARTLSSVNALPNERLACMSLLRVDFTGSVRIWNAYSVYKP
jgi:ferredoxin